MIQRFTNQVAIIAGGARGIGKGIARRLASEGCKVGLWDVLQQDLEETAREFQEEGFEVWTKIVDISDEAQIQESFAGVGDRLDILVNCAGLVGDTAVNIIDYESEVFDRVLAVNLKGAFLLTKYAIPLMQPNNFGRILHISSIGGKEGNPGMVAYAASKAGLIGLIKAVGKEYAQSGITVNGLAPAVIMTDMVKGAAPETVSYMRSKIPMNRFGTIEEAAALSCWIVSKEASFNTGFVFDLSGGRATF